MEEIKKINFSALKNNEAEIEKKDISSPKEENKKTTNIVTVSLGKKKEILSNSIKTEIKKEETKKEDITNNTKNKKEEKNTEIIEKPLISLSKVVKENKTEINSKKEDIKIEETKIEKSESIIEKEEKLDEKIIKEPENLFSNYQSDFNTKQDTIIEKLKKLKNLPKTRPKLVYTMLGIMVIGVSGLIFIAPNNSVLKADIIGVEQVKIPEKDNIDLSKIAKQKAEKLKAEKLKKEQEKNKKQKLENFLLNKNKNSNNLPENKNKEIIKNIKAKQLKELLLKSKENK